MQKDYDREVEALLDGFDVWARRQGRRRTAAARTLALTVGVAACMGVAAMLIPQRTDTYVTGNLSCCTDQACTILTDMLERRATT